MDRALNAASEIEPARLLVLYLFTSNFLNVLFTFYAHMDSFFKLGMVHFIYRGVTGSAMAQ